MELFLGVLASLDKIFEVESNKESGQGRYDIALFPRENNPNKLGIIIELKMDRILYKKKKFDLDIYADQLRDLADKAIDQILEKNYVAEFRQKNITEILAVGIAFGGKYLEGTSRRTFLT